MVVMASDTGPAADRSVTRTLIADLPLFDLEALIAAITPDNQHYEIETGHPVGADAA
jgi:antitoxin component of MazEF toxin-antitoxin module